MLGADRYFLGGGRLVSDGCGYCRLLLAGAVLPSFLQWGPGSATCLLCCPAMTFAIIVKAFSSCAGWLCSLTRELMSRSD
ncbi:hypothetical protein LSTR_LSTR008471 [Laodelphax striatellus]|uniref:Uncharacterized protein n=1 Tax=Laodelphax striatellus TaxID=195883 RepID=A0A482XSS9_LAOST|nr:hypothetical protein LSTR_LSTR008471 [Laodelphax striatellus]